MISAQPLWAISPANFDQMLSCIRQAAPQPAAAMGRSERKPTSSLVQTIRNVSVVTITGTIVKNPTIFSWLFQETSTIEIKDAVQQALRDPNTDTIFLAIDSHGGTVDGLADAADAIFAARGKKKVLAHVDGMAASAGYWLASQASTVTASRTAIVGSIGVFIVIDDVSALFGSAGIKRHVVRFGAHKGAGFPGTEVTPEHLEHIQTIVDSIGAIFVGDVARGRGFQYTAVKALADGRAHVAARAHGLRMIDGIKSFDEAMWSVVHSDAEMERRKIAALVKRLPAASDAWRLDAVRRGETLEQAVKRFEAQQKVAAEEAAEKERRALDQAKRRYASL